MVHSKNAPSYDQPIGPNFVAIGTLADLAEAARVAGSPRVYAALRPTEDSIRKQTNLHHIMALPCLWFYLPCTVPIVLNQQAHYCNVLYVITEDSVIISVGGYTPPCACGCFTDRDSVEISFDSVTDVVVDNFGSGCNSLRPPSVALVQVNKRETLLVDNIEDVAHLTRELRRAAKDRRGGPAAVLQPPVTIIQGHAQPRRIFVAPESNPTAVSIVNLASSSAEDWNKLLEEIRRTLGMSDEAELKLMLADFGARITRADHLSANDKVLVSASS